MTDSPRVVDAPLPAELPDPTARQADGPLLSGGRAATSSSDESGSGSDAPQDAVNVASSLRPSLVRLYPGGPHDPILCQCPRCTGFGQGNGYGLKHGVYASPVKLAPETNALAEELAPLVPMATAADSPAIQLLALALVRIGRADAAISTAEDEGDEERVRRLDERARNWSGTAIKLLDALAMTPSSRARFAKDAAAGIASEAVLADLLSRGRELRLGRNS